MTIYFKYKGHAVKNSTVYRPEILVRFRNGGIHQDVSALIDSGADTSAIPKGLAEYLELELGGQRHTAKGVGGSIEVINSSVDLEIGDANGREKHLLHRVPVQVNLSDDEGAFILLGRGVFFSEFEITFREADRRIMLKRHVKRGHA